MRKTPRRGRSRKSAAGSSAASSSWRTALNLTKVLRSATAREVFTLLGRARNSGGSPGDEAALKQVADPGLPPDLLLLAFDACQRLLELLETDGLRQVAVWKLAGHTNAAIAAKLGRSAATVERTLSSIRETWRRTWVERHADGIGEVRPAPGLLDLHQRHGITRTLMSSRPTMRTPSSATWRG